MAVRAIPEGYETLTPYLIVRGAAEAIEFYKRALGAVEVMRMPAGDGRIGHAEVRIGKGYLMLADEDPARGFRAPSGDGKNPSSLLLYVEDCDAVVDRAIAAGATLTQAPVDQFYGDRSGGFTDPFGHSWYVSTHIRDVSEEEMRRVMEERAGASAAAKK